MPVKLRQIHKKAMLKNNNIVSYNKMCQRLNLKTKSS